MSYIPLLLAGIIHFSISTYAVVLICLFPEVNEREFDLNTSHFTQHHVRSFKIECSNVVTNFRAFLVGFSSNSFDKVIACYATDIRSYKPTIYFVFQNPISF